MLYLGIDGHSKWNRTEGFNPNTGETISMPKVSNNPDILKEEFSKLDGPLYGAMEAGTNAWAIYWTLLPFFEELIVVDPLETWGREGRRGAKTDRRDALKLAEKLYRGELKALYVPDEVTQDWRCLIRARISATRKINKLVNEIGALLRSWGIVTQETADKLPFDVGQLPGNA